MDEKVGGVPKALLDDAVSTASGEIMDLIASAMDAGVEVAGASCEEQALDVLRRFRDEHAEILGELRQALAFTRVHPLVRAMVQRDIDSGKE